MSPTPQPSLLFIRKFEGLKAKEEAEKRKRKNEDEEEERRKELTLGKPKTNRYSPRSRTRYGKPNSPNPESM
jgi:hypothetical protein